MPSAPDTTTAASFARKPREDEIDAHGMTHPGKVRKDNQDHFVLCSLRKQLVLRLSSIPDADRAHGRERAARVARHGGRRRGRRGPR